MLSWLRECRDLWLLKKERDILRSRFEAYLKSLPKDQRERERVKLEAELDAMRKQVAEERTAAKAKKKAGR
jgi:hypothetical protein